MRLFLSSGDIVLIRLIYGIINQPAHPNLEAVVLVKLSLSPSSTSTLPAFVPTATFLSPFRANRCDTRTVGNNYSFVHYYKYRVLLLSLLPGWQLDCCDSHPLPPKTSHILFKRVTTERQRTRPEYHLLHHLSVLLLVLACPPMAPTELTSTLPLLILNRLSSIPLRIPSHSSMAALTAVALH